MNTEFDITLYGAVGDGVTDCTASIQRAFNDAAKCRGKVIVPPGTYSVSHLHMHGQAVSLVGASSWSFRSPGSSTFVLNDENVSSLLDITGAFGCCISGMSFEGRSLGKNIHGIYVYWPEYNGGSEEDTPTLDDCRVNGFSGDGVHLEHIWCFSVRHSMLSRNKNAGLFIDGWDAFLSDNWFTANEKGGILGGEICCSITCTGNRVEWNKSGGFIFPRGDSYNITGNFFDRNFGPALSLGKSDAKIKLVTVTGNIFRRSGAYNEGETPAEYASCHLKMQNCINTVISANSMQAGVNDGGGGILTPHNNIIIGGCYGCIVKDNTMIRGARDESIIITSANDSCIIENNISLPAATNPIADI